MTSSCEPRLAGATISDQIEYDTEDNSLALSLLQQTLSSAFNDGPLSDPGTLNSSITVGSCPTMLWRVLSDGLEIENSVENVPAQSPNDRGPGIPAWLQLMVDGIKDRQPVIPGVTSTNYPNDGANDGGLIEVKVDRETAANIAAWLPSMVNYIDG
ncbi:hypothetical protein L211DRAFT_854222 [Terfezia boudieri ATCC MYA-4762]|uniref:Uncharacterized protein n=1 Tax=Terfezia boudieri ATCC MYA-4762 TaxID=1051890 RepID=A0A3N4L607_9PEZI|nr:hypothetical protein L211DRAFT_854222 [Terfezia boudieri ATCC MYA-4762]